MNHTVYFADKALIFTAEDPGGGWHVVVPDTDAEISRTKVEKILETHNCVAVVSPDPDRAFGAFAAQFTAVTAAGGVVVNDRGEWLLIHRNDRWDLPKGHLEPDESLEQCAAREIAEETGVRAEVVRPLCETLHAYYFPKTGRWELKRTCWYELYATAYDAPMPQIEEGIDRVVWCGPAEALACAAGSFPTVRKVLECLAHGDFRE